MKKPKLIIIEGSQGVGKGTITNMLRERIPYSTLMRLSGIRDKSKTYGESKVYRLRESELNMISSCYGCDTTFIMDRSHLSEKVYCNLGYKEYDFKESTKILNSLLNLLTYYYDVYIIGLILNDISLYEDRLKRNKAEVEYSKFSSENSIKQQLEYINEIKNIAFTHPKINCAFIDASNSPEHIFDEIKEYCKLEVN